MAAAGLGFLRDYNEALVVAIARRTETFDRSAIAAASGLTPQAVSKVIARLTEAGLVVATGQRRHGVGKPATVYALIPSSRYAIGAHVARTTLRVVVADLVGAVVDSTVLPLPADFTPAAVLDRLDAEATRLTAVHHLGQRLVGVGIGMVGPLDFTEGVVRDAHRLRRWHDVPLRELAEARLGLPVILDKDVTAGVTAEAWRRGIEFRDAAFVMVESGIGCGLWLGGHAYRGAHTNAGEFGHHVIALDGPLCACGRHGCLDVVHDHAVAAGDLERAARVLGTGIVNLLQTIDVDHVVLAGTDVLARQRVYLDAVERAVRTEVPRPDWLPVRVTMTSLGADAVAAGAAMQVINAGYGLRAPSDPAAIR
jgi:predicted NBD/HSP70 family sugar kinase